MIVLDCVTVTLLVLFIVEHTPQSTHSRRRRRLRRQLLRVRDRLLPVGAVRHVLRADEDVHGQRQV
jgi:hypothetical protein